MNFSKKKLVSFTLLLLFLLTSSLTAYAEEGTPGNRPDVSPNRLISVFRSHEDMIWNNINELLEIKEEEEQEIENLSKEHEKKIKELEHKLEEAITRREEEDIKDEIKNLEQEYEEKLNEIKLDYSEQYIDLLDNTKNLVTSPIEEEDVEYRDKTTPNTFVREQTEAYIAAKNLRKVANEQIQKLMTDRSDYEQAERTYQSLKQLFELGIMINEDLIQRVNQHYGPRIHEQLTKVNEYKERLESDEELVDIGLSNINQIKENLENALRVLPEIERKAEIRREKLLEQKHTVDYLIEEVQLAAEMEEVLGNIQLDISQLHFETPEIPDYEVEEIDFDL